MQTVIITLPNAPTAYNFIDKYKYGRVEQTKRYAQNTKMLSNFNKFLNLLKFARKYENKFACINILNNLKLTLICCILKKLETNRWENSIFFFFFSTNVNVYQISLKQKKNTRGKGCPHVSKNG